MKRTKAVSSRSMSDEPGPRGSSDERRPPRGPGSATIDLPVRPSPLIGKALGGLPVISVTDIWFRSTQSLISLAATVGLSSTVHDSEDFWEWVIGDLGDVRLDITRAHALARKDTDVRIFRLDSGEFDAELRERFVLRVLPFSLGSVKCGRWLGREGNDFDVIVVEERPPNKALQRW
jgi:hypothetical protein